ncbi:MAG: nucleotidyltransferase family protein [Deltaproteobacteria bacterium]|nr:nucleotidyltransferase family protein [Deltaproteobacteria bacterium]
MRLEDLKNRRKEILAVAHRYGASNVRVFGSVAHGDAGDDSDIDFLMDIDDDRSLLDIAGLITDLEDLLHRRVEIAEPSALHWFIRDRVMQEAVAL